MKVRIEKLVYGGQGLGRVQGKVVFVPLAAPGDELEVEIQKEQGDYLIGKIKNILVRAACRVDPPCQYFGFCGGCQMQHLHEECQRECKKEFILEAFDRIAGQKDLPGLELIFGPAWGTRNRVQWKYHIASKGLRLGFFQNESNRVVDIEKCPLLAKTLNEKQAHFREMTQTAKRPRGEIEAVCDSSGAWAARLNTQPISGAPVLVTDILGKKIYWGVDVFFQNNAFLISSLVQEAVAGFSGKMAVELYAGVGLFSAFLAELFESVHAVEENPSAKKFFLQNIQKDSVRFFDQRAEEWLYSCASDYLRPDLVLADPPRSGLSQTVRELLTLMNPPQISYISCNPTTLARDLRHFFNHGYVLKSLKGFDLFPQTYHVECVAKLEKN